MKTNRTSAGRACGRARSGGFFFLAEAGGYAIDDFVERSLRAEAGEGVEFIDAGDATHHVLEARFVGLIVGHEFDGRSAAGALLDPLSEAFDADFFGVADVDDFTDGAVRVHEADDTFDGVAHVAEATGLLAVAVDSDRFVVESLLDEIGQDHAVAAVWRGPTVLKKRTTITGSFFSF